LNLEAKLAKETVEKVESEQILRDKALHNQQLIMELEHSGPGGNGDISKLEELSKNIDEIATEKTELEELYLKTHTEIVTFRSSLIEA
jgi:O-succinylbenzoate synthase